MPDIIITDPRIRDLLLEMKNLRSKQIFSFVARYPSFGAQLKRERLEESILLVFTQLILPIVTLYLCKTSSELRTSLEMIAGLGKDYHPLHPGKVFYFHDDRVVSREILIGITDALPKISFSKALALIFSGEGKSVNPDFVYDTEGKFSYYMQQVLRKLKLNKPGHRKILKKIIAYFGTLTQENHHYYVTLILEQFQ